MSKPVNARFLLKLLFDVVFGHKLDNHRASSSSIVQLDETHLRETHLVNSSSIVHLDKANLRGKHLEGTHLEREDLMGAHLEGAFLMGAYLEGAFLNEAHLEGADLREAHLEGALLGEAHLEGAHLMGANLERAFLGDAHLEGALLDDAYLESADLSKAHLEGAKLRKTHLNKANLCKAHLEGANFREAHLEGTDLREAHLEGKIMSADPLHRIRQSIGDFPQELPPADLRNVFFDNATSLGEIILGDEKHGFVLLADIRWGDVNLAVVNWGLVKILGDERRAQQKKYGEKSKGREGKLKAYRAAIRAYRQLASVLREQGMNERAAHFAYRAQLLRQRILWLQVSQSWEKLWEKKQNMRVWRLLGRIRQWVYDLGAWLRRLGTSIFWLLLGVLAGYGYRPGRSLLWYLFLVFGFATAYYMLGHTSNPALSSPLTAFFFSLTSFHGRGFFPSENAHFGDTIVLLSSIEAAVGLFVEVSFIAAFTQRFYGK